MISHILVAAQALGILGILVAAALLLPLGLWLLVDSVIVLLVAVAVELVISKSKQPKVREGS